MTDSLRGARPISWNVFIPAGVMLGALLLQAGYQTVQLRNEHDALIAQFEQQKQPLDESQKLRTQLESLAGATAILAEQGNQNAVRLRDYLAQQGVTIRPPAPPAPPSSDGEN